MRIAYLSTSTIPSRAANSVHVMKMCHALAANGHQPLLFARRGEGATTSRHAAYGIPEDFEICLVEEQAWGRLRGLSYAVGVARRTSALAPFDLYYGRHAASLLLVSRRGTPLMFEAHQLPKSAIETRIQRALFASPSFARLVVISEALRQAYRTEFKLPEKIHIEVAHDAASPEKPGGDNLPAWPARPGALQVGYMGHLYPGKGADVVVELARRLPAMDFHVVGGEAADLARLAGKSVPPNLHLHGFVAHEYLSQVLRRFDAALAPYQKKVSVAGGGGDISRFMSPLKIFEYMAHRRAIVASGLPVLREVLDDRRNALLVAPDDPAAWESALIELQENPSLRAALGAAAYADWSSSYSWSGRARKVLC